MDTNEKLKLFLLLALNKLVIVHGYNRQQLVKDFKQYQEVLEEDITIFDVDGCQNYIDELLRNGYGIMD